MNRRLNQDQNIPDYLKIFVIISTKKDSPLLTRTLVVSTLISKCDTPEG